MNDYQGYIPLLEGILRRTMQIPPDTKVLEVVDLFRGEHSLLAVPVVSAGKFIGFVSRKGLFFKRLSHKYALDLYGNKPISLLLEGNPTVMEPDLDVNTALNRLLAVDPDLESDCFPVTEGDRYVGIVSVSDLMMEISRTQSFLLDKVLSLSARIRDEVAKASKIQQDLLPRSKFEFRDLVIDACVTTCSEVGGDFYDYFTIDDDKLGLIIADVSGHGVQAGMVTTAAKASLHTLISMGVHTPAELMSGINKAVIATTSRALLMTCLVVLIEPRMNRLHFANAGHNFPYVYRGRKGNIEHIQELSGFPLGFEADGDFREFCTSFDSGDSLILYTDGIIECSDPQGEMFGYERFERLLNGKAGMPPHALRAFLLESAMDFTGSKEFEDDVTMMIVSRRQSAV